MTNEIRIKEMTDQCIAELENVGLLPRLAPDIEFFSKDMNPQECLEDLQSMLQREKQLRKNRAIHYKPGGGCCHITNRSWRKNKIHTTKKMAEVTCCLCLNIINEKNLREKKEFPKIPAFMTEIVSGLAVFTCPVCGAFNEHGVGPSHRVSHCDCWGNGYYIELPNQ